MHGRAVRRVGSGGGAVLAHNELKESVLDALNKLNDLDTQKGALDTLAVVIRVGTTDIAPEVQHFFV